MSTDIGDRLEAMEWAQVRFVGSPIANICPACSALVAVGDGNDRPHRTQHINWHRANDR